MTESTTAEGPKEARRIRLPSHSQIATVFGAASCAGVLLAVVMLSLEDRPEGKLPGSDVFEFIAHLPTSIWTYVVIGLIVLLGLTTYWYALEKSKADLDDLSDGHSTTRPRENRDLFVVGELRRRALSLRTRAAMFLGSSVVLLWGGVYFTVWAVPLVSTYDIEERVRSILPLKYGDALDALSRGVYWLYSGEIDASEDPYLKVLHNEGADTSKEDADTGQFTLVVEGGAVLVSEDGLDWKTHESFPEDPVNEATGVKGEVLVRLEDRSLWETRDGGVTWQGRSDDPALSDRFVPRGRLGIVQETEIAVFVKDVEQRSWRTLETLWPEDANGTSVELAEFDAEGRHGLIGTRDGAVHVTDDGGEEWQIWTRENIGLNQAEWPVEAVVGDEGPRLIVGDEGSVRVRVNDRWESARGVDGWNSITVFEFRADGKDGLVGTLDGAVHVTDDGGQVWRTWTQADIGLNRNEWPEGAVVGDEGPRLVVGDEGTVLVQADGEWERARSLGGRVTVVEFGADGMHGLVGTLDGAVHVTDDGGKEWHTWTRENIGLNRTEWAVGAAVGDEGPRLVVGDEGSVRVRVDDGWESARGVDGWNSVTVVGFGAGGRRGLVITGDGSVHVTEDGGKNWNFQQDRRVQRENQSWTVALIGDSRHILLQTSPLVYTIGDGGDTRNLSEVLSNAAPLRIVDQHVNGDLVWFSTDDGAWWSKGDGNWLQLPMFESDDESIAAITLDENDEPIVIGSRGTTLIDDKPERGYGDLVREEDVNVVAVAAAAESLFALVKEGSTYSVYVRRKFPDLPDDPLALARFLPKGNQLRQDLVSDIPELVGPLESAKRPEDRTLIEKLGVGQNPWLRVVATFATIYLVQLFVGLYRYLVRLAAFWDSRADAVLLGPSFSGDKPSFDDLIAALGPDALDFKPPRHPYFPSWRGPRKSDES